MLAPTRDPFFRATAPPPYTPQVVAGCLGLGLSPGMPSADYYLSSEFMNHAQAARAWKASSAGGGGDDGRVGNGDGSGGAAFLEQVVTLSGLGVPWPDAAAALGIAPPPQEPSAEAADGQRGIENADGGGGGGGGDDDEEEEDSAGAAVRAVMASAPGLKLPSLPADAASGHAPLRYSYRGHIFFSSDRVFVVSAPTRQLWSPAFDGRLCRLLKEDRKAVVVLAPPPSTDDAVNADSALGSRIGGGGGRRVLPTQWHARLLGRLRGGCLKGDREAGGRLVLLAGLGHSDRLDLLRVADALLDPFPVGGGVGGGAVLEALALATPVLTTAAWAVAAAATPVAAPDGACGRGRGGGKGNATEAARGTSASACQADFVAEAAAAGERENEGEGEGPVEHGFAANFLQALYSAANGHDDDGIRRTGKTTEHPPLAPANTTIPAATVAAASATATTGNSGSAAVPDAATDAEVLAAMAVRPGAGAWVAGARRLSEPNFKLAAKRALRRWLHAWTTQQQQQQQQQHRGGSGNSSGVSSSSASKANDAASFIVSAAVVNRRLQRLGHMPTPNQRTRGV